MKLTLDFLIDCLAENLDDRGHVLWFDPPVPEFRQFQYLSPTPTNSRGAFPIPKENLY
jgi:hypothetical protein